MDNEPIFRSVDQALSFSFYIQHTEMASKGCMQILSDMQPQDGEWLDKPASTIHFGGLTPQEVRGQCAMVRGAVEDHLKVEHERDAIYARFTHGAGRAAGVRGLRDYFQGICRTQNSAVLLALIWAIYKPAKRKGDGWSLRSIEKEYGLDKMTLHYDQQLLRNKCVALENLAKSRLEELFVRDGLIGDPAYA